MADVEGPGGVNANELDLHALFENEQVRDVVIGRDVGASLDAETIRRCASPLTGKRGRLSAKRSS
jgi:hypothetical protein